MIDIVELEMKFYDLLDKLPLEISLYHPHVVHFAVALPFTALIFQWFSIVNPNKGYQNSSTLLFSLSTIAIILAFMTGYASTLDVKSTLSTEGQDVFDMHKTVGTYLTFGFIFLIFLKLFANIAKKDALRHLIALLTLIALVAVAYEAKTGYELVYNYSGITEFY